MTPRFLTLLCLSFSIVFTSVASGQQPLALEGHSGAVTSAAYSPDGKLIVTGSYDQTLGIYNAAEGSLLRTLTGHTGQVFSVAISPNGRQVMSASRDGTVKIWDLYLSTPLAQLESHTGAVNVVELSADGNWLLTGSADKSLKLWQREESKLLFDMTGHEAAITRAAIAPGNAQLASGDAAGTLRLWNPVDGVPVAQLGAHTAEITGLAYHPGGEVLLTSAADGIVKSWSLPPIVPVSLGEAASTPIADVAISADAKLKATATGDTVTLYQGTAGEAGVALADQPGPVTALELTANASLLASGSETGVVKLWSTADQTDKLTLRGHTGAIHDLSFNPEATQLATAGADGTIRLWRQPQAAVPLAGEAQPMHALATSADGKWIATAGEDMNIHLFNAADGTQAASLEGHAAKVTGLSFTADSSQLASADATGAIYLWEIASQASLAKLQGPSLPITGVEYLPDGKTLLTTSESGAMTWWQLPPTAAVPLAGHTVEVNQMAVTSTGKSIVTGSADGSIRVFSAAEGKPTGELAGQVGSLTALAATDTLAASGNERGRIQLWNMADSKIGLPLIGSEAEVTALAVQPGGKQLASAGTDGVIRFWKPPTAASSFPGSDLAPKLTVFSDDRSLVATAGMAAGKPAVVVRQTADGKTLGTLLGHAGAISSVAFGADNQKIVTGSADKTARVWDLTDPKYPEIANFAGHTTSVTAVSLAPKGAEVYSADSTGAIKRWNLADQEETSTLEGHTAAVSRLLFAGATLVSASADQTVRTWNVSTGKAQESFSHGAAVTSLAISSDQKQLASGGADNTIKIFPLAGGEASATLAGCTAPIRSLDFNATGTRVVACGGEASRMWDTTGLPLQQFPLAEATPLAVAFAAKDESILCLDTKHTLHSQPISILQAVSGHEAGVSSLAYSPDGKQLFSAGADKAVRRWNSADGVPLDQFTGPTGAVTDLSLSTDGKQLVAGSADNNVYLWPVGTAAKEPVAASATFANGSAATAVSAGVDGSRIAASKEDGSITVWDVESSQVLEQLSGHTAAVTDLALSGENNRLISASVDKTAVILPLTAQRVITAAEAAIVDLALSTDGTLAAIVLADNTLKLINTADAEVMHQVAIGAAASTIAIRGDQTQLAVGLADKSLSLYPLSAKGFGEPMPITLSSVASSLDYATEGGKLAVSTAESISVHDSATGSLLEQHRLEVPAIDVALLPDGMTLAATTGSGGVIQPLSLLRSIAAHEGAATGVAIMPDGTTAISGGADKAVHQWNLADGTKVGSMSGPAEAIVALDQSTDGKFLAAITAANNLFAWDLSQAAAAEEPREAMATIALSVAATDVSITADGSRIATADSDGVVRVYDVASTRQLERFPGEEGAVTALEFAADGKTLLVGGANGATRLLSLSATQLIVADETRIGDLAMLPEGNQFVTTGNDMLAKIWNADGTVAKQLTGAKGALDRLALSSDATLLAAADTAGNVQLWNMAEGAALQTIEAGAVANQLAFSPGGTQLALAGADNHLRVYDTADATLLQDQTAAAPLLAAEFTPEGHELITGGANKLTSTWAYASPVAVGDLTGHTGPIYAVAYNQEGTQVVTCGADGTIRLWDPTTGAAVSQLSGHVGAVYTVRYTPDGKQLLSAGLDGTARLWDIASAKVTRTFAPMPVEGETLPPLFDTAINAQGTLVATGGSSRTIQLWNAANGQAGKQIEGHADAIYRLAFQGNRLLSLGQAGNLHSWTTAGAAQGEPLKLPAVSFSAALSPEGTKAVIPSADGKAYVVDLPK